MQKKQSFAAETAVASISRSRARDRRPGIRLDERLISEAAQVKADLRRQAHGDADARHVGEAADYRVFLCAQLSFFVACHHYPCNVHDRRVSAGLTPDV